MCTCNRSLRLDIALEWLDGLETPLDSQVEVVVVDNNSSDETFSVLSARQKNFKFKLKHVIETQQGVGYARNAGVAAASGDILAFIDDDCLPRGDWLVEIERAFLDKEGLAAAGGRVDLYDERDLPITIRTSQDPVMLSAHGSFSQVLGCNMCFRRSAIDSIGSFDERFGAGTALCSSEDSDYIYRMLRVGLRVAYIPDIHIFHAHGRRTSEAARRLKNGYMTGRGAFYCKHILAGDVTIMKRAYWEFRSLARGAAAKPSGRSRSVMVNLLKGMLRYIGVTIRRKLSRA